MHLLQKLKNFLRREAHMGPLGSAFFIGSRIADLLKLDIRDRVMRMWPRGYAFPFYARCQTSDLWNFFQIFVEREYACLDDVEDPRFIVDCGAYVGYSSLYFLHRFPKAAIVAIEPDPDNFRMLKRNVSPYGNRIRLIRAAVWTGPEPLSVSRRRVENFRFWSTEVLTAPAGGPCDIVGIHLDDVLRQAGFPRIDILKIDVEGAESQIFSRGFESWLARTRNIAVEIHGAEREPVVSKALEGYRYDRLRSGELTIFKNLRMRGQMTDRDK